MSLSRFWSLLNQYSQTLNIVGSMTEKDLEYLSRAGHEGVSEVCGRNGTHFISLRFLYFSLLYSVLSE